MKALFVFLCVSFFVSCTSSAQTNLPLDEFVKAYQKTENAQLLDVRTPAEWQQGKLNNSECADFLGKDFDEQASKLDKSKPVFVYCAAGGRSAKAAAKLKEAGFEHIYNLTNAGYAQLKARGIEK